MRTAVCVMIIAVVSCAIWQRRNLAELRATETELRGHAAERLAKPRFTKEEKTALGDRQIGFTEAELAQFTAGVLKFRDLYKAGKNKLAAEQMEALDGSLERLTSEQLAAVFEAWTEGPPITDEFIEGAPGLTLFANIAAAMNPGAMLEFLCAHSYAREDLGGVVQTALANLFRRDPDGLLAWTRAQRFPPATEKLCAMWADAARVALEPTGENVRRFLSRRAAQAGPNQNSVTEAAAGPVDAHPYFQKRMRNEIALKLSTQEARLEFFRVLREVEGEGGKEMQAFIGPLTKRVSFAQLAQIADSVTGPTTAPSTSDSAAGSPNGLRFQVALNSRDGTPSDRWMWLTQREADRPSGAMLRSLVGCWCEDNYAATAELVRSLPKSAERKAMTAAVLEFLEMNEGGELTVEWTGK